LVHGTGVRLAGSDQNLKLAQATAADCSIKRELVGCDWGDPFGVEFVGASLPDPPDLGEAKQDADFAQWVWILDDPLLELSMLTVPDTKPGLSRTAADISARTGLERLEVKACDKLTGVHRRMLTAAGSP